MNVSNASRGVDVSIAIVAHNTRALLEACLTSIEVELECYAGVIEVFVVDAASNDGTAAMVERGFPWVRLIAAGDNVGFTRGTNRALRIAAGRHLLLLNPDTEVAPGAIQAMAHVLDRQPAVGAVGPQLRFPDGSVQSSRRRFPGRATAFVESTVLERWLGRSRLIREFRLADRSDAVAQDVDWLVGACLMIRRDVLHAVGLLDESFFMYSEEVDLCRRIRGAGWRIVYLPEAVVIHHEGKSSEQNLVARDLRFHESRILYYARYHGRLWSLGLRLATLAHFAFLLGEESAKFVLGHNRPLRRRRVSAYREVAAEQARRLWRAAPVRA